MEGELRWCEDTFRPNLKNLLMCLPQKLETRCRTLRLWSLSADPKAWQKYGDFSGEEPIQCSGTMPEKATANLPLSHGQKKKKKERNEFWENLDFIYEGLNVMVWLWKVPQGSCVTGLVHSWQCYFELWKFWGGGQLEADDWRWTCVGSFWCLNPTLLPGHLWPNSLPLWCSIWTYEPNTRKIAACERTHLKSWVKIVPLNCLEYFLQQQQQKKIQATEAWTSCPSSYMCARGWIMDPHTHMRILLTESSCEL